MKRQSARSILIIVFLILCMFSVSAGTIVLDSYASTGLSINAVLGDFYDISITPTRNDGHSIGIPFSITGSDVLASSNNTNGSLSGYGRQIATWTVVMNEEGNRCISIQAEPLKRVTDSDGNAVTPDTPICYWLSFALRYRAYRSGKYVTEEGYIGVYGNNSLNTFSTNFDNFTPAGTDTPFISQNQPVRVILVKDNGQPYSSSEILAWPAGVYTSVITITLGGS